VGDSRAPIFASSNPNKAAEAARILGRPLHIIPLPLPEIQAAHVEAVTRSKLEAARAAGYSRVIVEDVSLGLDELGQFPGPHIKWLLEAAGGKGLATIASALHSRAANAQCCVGYWDGAASYFFLGECPGEVLLDARGENNFGWDAWFQPRGTGKTFAEMTPEEKDRVSHRGHAYRQLAAHLDRESAPHIGRN
jgi:XTP/dITP diphosphohydrolase